MVIYGFNAVREAIRARPRSVRYVGVAEDAKKGRVFEIVGEAKGAGIAVRRMPGRQIDALVPRGVNHNGVVAEVSEAAYADVEEIAGRETTRFVLLLDGITDPQNLGAILRVAHAFGVDLVVIPEHGSVGLSAAAVKASAGAASWVPTGQVTNLARTIEMLKERGFWVYGADAEGEPVVRVDFAERVALVMGSEEKGMRRNVREHCDVIVSIPMSGKVSSLNVATAAAVLCWEVQRPVNGRGKGVNGER
jgi:23S rRNA (guanosine2251-2'-O)-methyltransferase